MVTGKRIFAPIDFFNAEKGFRLTSCKKTSYWNPLRTSASSDLRISENGTYLLHRTFAKWTLTGLGRHAGRSPFPKCGRPFKNPRSLSAPFALAVRSWSNWLALTAGRHARSTHPQCQHHYQLLILVQSKTINGTLEDCLESIWQGKRSEILAFPRGEVPSVNKAGATG